MLVPFDRQLGLYCPDYSQQVAAFGQIIPRTWSLLAYVGLYCMKFFPADLSQFVDIWPCFGHWKPKSLIKWPDYSQIIPSRFVAICRNCSHKMRHLDGKSIAKWSNCSQRNSIFPTSVKQEELVQLSWCLSLRKSVFCLILEIVPK